MTYLVAFDPGPHTGVAEGKVGRDKISTTTALWTAGVVDCVQELVRNHRDDMIWVVEAFNLLPSKTGPKTFSSFPEIEVIGYLRGIAEQEQIYMTTLTPGTYKPFASKIPVPRDVYAQDTHQQDAYRLYKYSERFIVPKLPQSE